MNKKENILIVEDDKGMRETLTLLLEGKGYSITAVDTSHKAFEEIKKHFHEVVVLDVRLPDLDGIGFLEKLREFQGETVPSEVIIITAYASEDVPVEAIKLGVSYYFLKPFDMDEFVASVDNCISSIRSEQEWEKKDEEFNKANEELEELRKKFEQMD